MRGAVQCIRIAADLDGERLGSSGRRPSCQPVARLVAVPRQADLVAGEQNPLRVDPDVARRAGPPGATRRSAWRSAAAPARRRDDDRRRRQDRSERGSPRISHEVTSGCTSRPSAEHSGSIAAVPEAGGGARSRSGCRRTVICRYARRSTSLRMATRKPAPVTDRGRGSPAESALRRTAFHSKGHTMRLVHGSAVAIAMALLVYPTINAQDAARAVAGGGISVPGWPGKIDAQEEKAGQASEQREARAAGAACTSPPGRPSPTGTRRTRRPATTP